MFTSYKLNLLASGQFYCRFKSSGIAIVVNCILLLLLLVTSIFYNLTHPEYAQEFTDMLVHGASNDELRRTLGKHVRLMFTRCQMIQFTFLHIANYTGISGSRNQQRIFDRVTIAKHSIICCEALCFQCQSF